MQCTTTLPQKLVPEEQTDKIELQIVQFHNVMCTTKSGRVQLVGTDSCIVFVCLIGPVKRENPASSKATMQATVSCHKCCLKDLQQGVVQLTGPANKLACRDAMTQQICRTMILMKSIMLPKEEQHRGHSLPWKALLCHA